MSSVIRGDDNFDSESGAALKAWVNFNGTGTVAIRASLNISSVIDSGVGNYTINFINSLPNANPAVTGTKSADTTYTGNALVVSTATAAYATVFTVENNSPADSLKIAVVVFS